MPDSKSTLSELLKKRCPPVTLKEKVIHWSHVAVLLPLLLIMAVFWLIPLELIGGLISWLVVRKDQSVHPLIKELVAYEDTGNAGPLLKPLESSTSATDLRLLCMQINGWLGAWGSTGVPLSNEPFRLPGDFPWCQMLRRVVLEEPNFSELFVADQHSVNFHDRLTWRERFEIRFFVRKNRTPPMIRK